MSLFETVLFAFGGPTALLLALGFFGKSLLEKLIARDSLRFTAELQARYTSDIERLKAELQFNSARQTEQLKAELQKLATEHQIRYSRLQDKRAEVIAKLYALMVEAFWEAESFLSPIQWSGGPTLQEKHAVAMGKLVDFFQYLERHRIYLPSALGDKVQVLAMDVRSSVVHFGVFTAIPEESLQADTYRQRLDVWTKGFKKVTEHVPAVKKALEEEFRSLLGDADPLPVVNLPV